MELEYGSAGLGVSLPDFGKARDYKERLGAPNAQATSAVSASTSTRNAAQ